ncbi:MAG TPA: homoserine dehydrogenase [Enterococcus sp.]|nr:homoserine dehydrogenase [Enterococcus sp.]
MKDHLRIGILGLGVVGSGTVQVLAAQRAKIKEQTGMNVSIVKALIRPAEDKKQFADEHGIKLTSELADIVEDVTLDVVIELIGKVHPAKEFITQALKNGKHVVTANKDLIAQHGVELVEIAKENNVSLFYEASVAGGIPILRTLTTNYLADEITNIRGIVNGTTNYMLTKMLENGTSYEEALAQAQALGFAESDPTNDVDGIDAAYKMVILTQFAYGMDVALSDLEIQGIRGLSDKDVLQAQKFGYEIKLIGESVKTDETISVSVGPALVPQTHPLASIKNEFNGVFINSTGIDQSMFYGPGAGSLPTATSVISDVAAIAKNISLGIDAPQFNEYRRPLQLTAPEANYAKYYFAVTTSADFTADELTAFLATEKVQVNELAQETGETNRFMIITESINRLQLAAVEAAIAKQGTLERRMRVMEA